MFQSALGISVTAILVAIWYDEGFGLMCMSSNFCSQVCARICFLISISNWIDLFVK